MNSALIINSYSSCVLNFINLSLNSFQGLTNIIKDVEIKRLKPLYYSYSLLTFTGINSGVNNNYPLNNGILEPHVLACITLAKCSGEIEGPLFEQFLLKIFLQYSEISSGILPSISCRCIK